MATSITDIPFRMIDGAPAKLGDFSGSVILVVNVASKCGLTPQYEGLERLYQRYRDQGLEIIGFPANNFAGQEPGTSEEIQTFCRTQYDVDFPLAEKISVTGDDIHPLYQALIAAYPQAQQKPNSELKSLLEEKGLAPDDPSAVMWNFEKFLISRDGEVINRFAPDITPEDERLTSAVETALAG